MSGVLFEADNIQRTAVIDPTGRYRYRLTRQWAPESEGTGSTLMPFCMLNPSDADADIDDPSIRRCMGFARREGMHGITVVNLGAGRSPHPSIWAKMSDPFGPDNWDHVFEVAETAGYLVAAWGAHPLARDRAEFLLASLALEGIPVLCLGVTKSGAPRHPLYVRGDQPLMPYGGVQ